MMASVFFMQPCGQIAGNLVSLITVAVCRRQGDADLARTVDIMWRWVIGIGVVPGVIALLFRFAIPETPRFILEVEDDPVKAEFDASTLFGEAATKTIGAVSPELEMGSSWSQIHLPSSSHGSRSFYEEPRSPTQTDLAASHPATLNSDWHLAKADIIQYFWTEGNWRTLAGTSLAWLLLDFGFYGIGLSSPQFLAKTWGTLNIKGAAPPWKTDDSPNVSVYDMFMDTSIHAMVILNAGSFLGGLLMILFAYRLNRVDLQKYGFLALAALFIALGTMFVTVHQEGPVAVVLYIVGQLLFNFGTAHLSHLLPLLSSYSTDCCRPQRNDIHDPRRGLPHALPRHLPRHQRGGGQDRLDPGAGLLGVLQVRLDAGRRADDAARAGAARLQRVHDPGRGGDALLDPQRAAGRGRAQQVLGRRDADAGGAGAGAAGGAEPVRGAVEVVSGVAVAAAASSYSPGMYTVHYML